MKISLVYKKSIFYGGKRCFTKQRSTSLSRKTNDSGMVNKNNHTPSIRYLFPEFIAENH